MTRPLLGKNFTSQTKGRRGDLPPASAATANVLLSQWLRPPQCFVHSYNTPVKVLESISAARLQNESPEARSLNRGNSV